jgi:cell division septation protein DedD
MKIAGYVGDLLYDYECVVIPGLGGFIAEDKSVMINKVTDKFSPPYRKIHFNIHLRANDGLLVNYVAQNENIPYKSAKQKVDKFVLLCHNALESGKKINFKSIGTIAYDTERNIEFRQDKSINYNANSFGLGTLVSSSIRRATDEDKIKKVVKSAIDKSKTKSKTQERTDKKATEERKPVTKSMQANRRKSPLTNQIIFLAFVMLAMGISYAYMRRDAMKYYFDRYSSHIPLFYSSVNDYLATNINSTPVAKLSRSTASLFPIVLDGIEKPEIVKASAGYVTIRNNDNSSVDLNTTKPDSEQEIVDENVSVFEEQPVIDDTKEVADEMKMNTSGSGIDNPEVTENKNYNNDSRLDSGISSSKRFFIIAGSFSSEQNAKNLVIDLKKQGFNALIADTNKYGMYRVAFTAINERNLANEELIAIRNNRDSKAWLLVK